MRRTVAWLNARLRRWPFVYYVLPPLVWMAAIYAFSAQPSLPQVPGPVWDLVVKKGAHAVAYAVLTVLLWRALAQRWTLLPALGLAAVLAILYAASDEVHQRYVPGRHGRPMDVAIDAIGVLLAAVMVWVTQRWEGRSRLQVR